MSGLVLSIGVGLTLAGEVRADPSASKEIGEQPEARRRPGPVLAQLAPPTAIPPVGRAPGAAFVGAPPPASAEPRGYQILAATLIAAGGVGGAVAVGVSSRSAVSVTVALLLAPVAAGAMVCWIGQSSPTRHGGCAGSMLGALTGAVIGVIPGALLVWAGSQPRTFEQDESDGIEEMIFGAVLAGVGYMIATPAGAMTGFNLGATRRDPDHLPPAAMASVLTVYF